MAKEIKTDEKLNMFVAPPLGIKKLLLSKIAEESLEIEGNVKERAPAVEAGTGGQEWEPAETLVRNGRKKRNTE